MLPRNSLVAAALYAASVGSLLSCGGTPPVAVTDAGGNTPDAGNVSNAPDAGSHDAGVTTSPDAGTTTRPDAGTSADAGSGIGSLPPRGGVTLGGGNVDRLYFALTGDTRPPICDVTLSSNYDYPTAQVTQIAQQMEARQPQFALDLGDHMFVCFGGSAEAQAQMGYYMTAIANFKAPFFMTMGNHECVFALGGIFDDCGANNTSDPCFVAFMQALAPTASTPYYFVDITTSMGLARLVSVADDAWNSTESNWLDSTLADADTKARYTIVARHHNLAASTTGNYPAIVSIIQNHKYALHLTAHTHTYTHDTTNDPSGRTVIVGTGGSSDATNPALGYATVVQGIDGRLYFTMYDSSTDLPIDTWNVGPN